MDIKKIFDNIRTSGLDTELFDNSSNGIFYKVIKKEEIKQLICQTLLESNTFPIDTNNIKDGCGWMIEKGSFFGYHLIQYGERSMSNCVECWRKWFLTRGGAANEYLKRATGEVLILVGHPSNKD